MIVDRYTKDPMLRRQVLAYGTDDRSRTLSAPENDSHSPRFAHRSDRVVFATGVALGPPAARRFVLELVDPATGARRQLTKPPEDQSDDDPRWSPDDAWISFRRAPIGGPDRGRIWVVAVDSAAATRLDTDAVEARWAP